MAFPAPYDRFVGEVKPEWVDLNAIIMNLAYYVVLFDYAFDLILAEWDLDWSYTKRTSQSLFAVESHTLYERELLVGEKVRVHSWVIAIDGKKLHIAHEDAGIAPGGHARRAACFRRQ